MEYGIWNGFIPQPYRILYTGKALTELISHCGLESRLLLDLVCVSHVTS